MLAQSPSLMLISLPALFTHAAGDDHLCVLSDRYLFANGNGMRNRTCRGTFISPPLGLLCLAGKARALGYPVFLVDTDALGLIPTFDGNHFHCETLRKYLEKVKRTHGVPTLVGIGPVFSTQLPVLPAVTEIINQVLPKARILVGGPHLTASDSTMLRELFELCPAIDDVICGEADEAIEASILFSASTDNVYSSTRCVVSKQSIVTNLDVLPAPAYDLIANSAVRIEPL